MKDIHWSISGTDYVIRNVPYVLIDGEEFLDLDISIKIIALRDLMYSNEISNDIDFINFQEVEL